MSESADTIEEYESTLARISELQEEIHQLESRLMELEKLLPEDYKPPDLDPGRSPG